MGIIWRLGDPDRTGALVAGDTVALKPEDVVDAYLSAIADRDFARGRSYLADEGFRFRSPVHRLDSADEFVGTFWGVESILDAVHREKRFVDGSEVLDILEFRVQISEPASAWVVHWATVENQKIVSIRTYFDAAGYAEMFPAED